MKKRNYKEMIDNHLSRIGVTDIPDKVTAKIVNDFTDMAENTVQKMIEKWLTAEEVGYIYMEVVGGVSRSKLKKDVKGDKMATEESAREG